MVKCVRNFNSDRSIAFSFDRETEQPTPFSTGLPQVSPISAVTFVIYSAIVDPLSSSLVQERSMTYVDDNTMLQPAKSVSSATFYFQEHFKAKQV